MIGKSAKAMQSNKVKGALWLVAALPMLLIPVLNDGNKGLIAIGIIFLIFGMHTLRQQ